MQPSVAGQRRLKTRPPAGHAGGVVAPPPGGGTHRYERIRRPAGRVRYFSRST